MGLGFDTDKAAVKRDRPMLTVCLVIPAIPAICPQPPRGTGSSLSPRRHNLYRLSIIKKARLKKAGLTRFRKCRMAAWYVAADNLRR